MSGSPWISCKLCYADHYSEKQIACQKQRDRDALILKNGDVDSTLFDSKNRYVLDQVESFLYTCPKKMAIGLSFY